MSFQKHILKLGEYKPPLEGRAGSLLLDFNERTEALPSFILKELSDWCMSGCTQVYPDYTGLLEGLSDYTGFNEDFIICGNGSDQLLDCLFRAMVEPGDKVLLPSPSFTMFAQYAGLASAEIKNYSVLNPNPLEELRSKLENEKIRLVVACQPNNPTGSLIPVNELRRLLTAHPETFFIVDEAYFEFSGESILEPPFILKNLAVTRTFSKAFGIAAFRLGYALAHPETISQLYKIRGPYDVNQMAVVAAKAVLKHREKVLAYAKEIMGVQKIRLEKKLTELNLKYTASRANFILIEDAEHLFESLLKKNIRVRKMTHPDLLSYIRISVGAEPETDRLIQALDEIALG